MSDTLDILKTLALQVRNASSAGENTAERIGRTLVGIIENLGQADIDSLKELFLSKKETDKSAEIIDFLKGLTINGDKATIDADGTATVQQLIALVKAKVAALEVTGNTKTNSLDVTETAKAKDVEVSNSVTTLNAVIQALAKTHDLAVENTADIMNGIIRQYLSSESFVSGFLGSGFKIWQDDNGLWHGELDELTVRKTFLVFELVVQKIVHQGGMIIRSAAGGKLKKVTDGGTYWKCEHDSTDDFVVGDQVLCQTFTGTSMKRYWRLVTSAGAGYFNLSKSDCEAGSANPEAGDEVAILGNRTVTARQKAQIDCAVGDDAPYRDDYSGINSYSLVGKLINRTGNLSGITDPDFGALSGSGLYGINVYLKGIFRLLSGKTVEDAISDAQAESNAYTDGKITKIETSFEIREGQISSKVTEATTAAKNADSSATLAQGYASTAGQKASAAAGSASDAANILTVVTQKETSIQQTAQAIELKAVRAESAAGRAESAEASINLKADGIVLQASNQAAKSAVDGVQVGGRNLMLGSESFIINGGITIGINFIPGQQYTISIEKSVNVNPGNQSGGSMLLYCADVEPYPLRIYIPISGSKQVATFTYPTTGKGNLNLCATEAWTGLSDITKLKIEIGNKATDWTPAPEDVAQDATTKANTAESNAKSYANNTFTTKTTYEAGIQILSGQISSKVSQTDFDTLGLAVSSHTSTINQLPTTIDQRITSQVADGGIIKTNVESWFTLSGNTISLGAKSLDISGAVVFNSLATQSQAQGYAKTAVDGVQVGGRNLALNSDIYINNNEYNIRDYLLSQDLIAGEIYTATIWGSLYSSKSHFGMWMGGGYTGISGLSKIKDGVYQATFTMPNSVEGNGYKNVINIYTVPYNIVGISTIYKFKLEQGNKATDWTPAPEDVAQDATNKANTAEGNAKGYSDVLKNSLGSLAYANTVSLAKLDTTIIEGGYIKTSLINANAIITNDLLATKIAATDITTRRLTVGEGCMVGGFSIGSGRIGISASPENIGNAGMFLYADMIGFNSTNRQAIVGTYSVLGYPRLGQFIDTTSNYMPNVGLMFDINSTNNGGRNYAFTGRGHGVLNGFMCGYAFQELSFTSANQWQEISKLTNVVGVYGNYSNWAVVLPTFASVCNALNISYNTPFQVQITVFCTAAVGSGKFFGRSNSGISGISGNQYPALYNWNADIDDGGFAMGPGDSFQIVLWSSNSGTSSVPANPGSYRAYIVNKLS